MAEIIPFAIPQKAEEDTDEGRFYKRFVENLELAESTVFLQKLPDDAGYVFGHTMLSTSDLILYLHHIHMGIQNLISVGSLDGD